MASKILEINLYGACSVKSVRAGLFEISGAKHKALFALLATAPFGRRTRVFLQETLWGKASKETGRQSLRRALADIKRAMGDSYLAVFSSTNSELTLDLDAVSFIGQPGSAPFLEGLDIRVPGFSQWLAEMRRGGADSRDFSSTTRLIPVRPSLPVVVVLPFRSVGSDANDAVLGDWLAEETCRSLNRARLQAVISHNPEHNQQQDVLADISSYRSLLVIARHSTFMFAQQTLSLQEIGSRLGVRYLLSGTLRRNGPHLHVAVDLTDAEYGTSVWSSHFDFSMRDLLDIQDEIAAGVAIRLAAHDARLPRINRASQPRETPVPAHIRSFDLTVQGQQLLLNYTRESNAQARRFFEEAIRISPNYGCAYSGISRTHNLDWRYSWSPAPALSLATAVDFANQAVQRDAKDARGHAELGFAKLYQRRHAESLVEYTRALKLNPDDADVIAEYGDALVYSQQPAKAVEMLEKAMRLNPRYPDWYLWYLADAYNAMGRAEDVIRVVERMQNPDQGRRMLAANYAHIGNIKKARTEAEAVVLMHPEFTISRWRDRPPYQDQSILERYIGGMRKAGLPE